MQVLTETELLERITAFRERHDDMAPTTFGRNATGNANLIRELEEGKSPSLRTVQRVAAYMDRTDAEAVTRAKLSAEPEPSPAVEEEEIALPFSSAPVNPTGASSPTSSSTSGRSTSSTANGSCRCSAGREPSAPSGDPKTQAEARG